MNAAQLVERLDRWRRMAGNIVGANGDDEAQLQALEDDLLEAYLEAVRERAAQDLLITELKAVSTSNGGKST